MVEEPRNEPSTPAVLLGRYQVDGVIGEGAFGIVVMAVDRVLKRRVAVKTLKRLGDRGHSDAFYDQEDRFIREAEAGSRVGDHPNIINVYDFVIDQADDVRYLIMEYAPGGTLERRLEATPPLPLADTLRLAADVARGLHAAHEEGIVHRDVKPGNIFLAADGRAQIGDFGIAQVDRLSRRTHHAADGHPGSPLYASPEQSGTTGYIRADSDQYSVGVVLFEMLTGKPFKRLREREVNRLLAEQPAAVATLVKKMAAELPDDRYESMEEVRSEIEAILAEMRSARMRAEIPSPQKPPVAPRAARPPARPHGVPPSGAKAGPRATLLLGMPVINDHGGKGTLAHVFSPFAGNQGAARVDWSGGGSSLVPLDTIHVDNGVACVGQRAVEGDAQSPPETPQILLDRYRIEAVIGGGGMGRVLRAFDSRLRRIVAIKALERSRGRGNAEIFRRFEDRFVREAEAGARFGVHPNLVSVFDLVQAADGSFYLIMEYASNETLAQRMQEERTFAPAVAVRLTADIARGLQVVHDKGIVHRDVKPANIFITADDRAMLGDFGIAQIDDLSDREHTTAGHPGTPLYMSPEQATTTGYLKPASDQYSLGLVLFEMLFDTAHKRLTKQDVASYLTMLPRPIAALIARLTEADPEDRYPDMTSVVAAIQAIHTTLDAQTR